MANSNHGSSATSNNYNLITSNETFGKKRKGRADLLDQARKSVFETLNLDETLVNRAAVANSIYEGRKDPLKVPTGKMELRVQEPKLKVDFDKSLYKHQDLKRRYEAAVRNGDNFELEHLDTEFAERLILDAGGSIEFKPNDKFIRGKDAKEESEIAFDGLNELSGYKGKIELVSRLLNDGDNYYVIKWKRAWINDVIKKYNELLKAEEDDEKKDDEKKDDEKKDDEKKDDEKKDDKLDNIIGERMNRMDEKDKELEELRRQNEEQNKRIKELEEKLNSRDVDTGDKTENSGDKAEDSEDETDNTDEENTDTDDILSNIETLDENSNYISRSFVEGLISKIREAEGYPRGTIEIKGEVINIEEFEFYEEFKQEYIEAKGDADRLSRLDKEFAEMIILFSPKGADYKDRYCIKLSESELKDGLYVSDERLARYGVSIRVSEYFEKVVEREVIRERKIIKKLETIITELQSSIMELTQTISIEKSSNEVILMEIKRKRELLLKLIKKQKVLLKSLKGVDNNDKELQRLKDIENNLQNKLDDLKNQKKVFTEIKEALDAIPDERKESIYIRTKDGKTCALEHNKGYFRKHFDQTDLFEGLGSVTKSELLEKLENSENIKEIIIGEENMPDKPKRFLIPENIKDINKEIEDVENELAEIRKKIEQEELKNKKRVVVEEFDDADDGIAFARFCEENGIKRKDGKEIPHKGGMDTSAIYVDKDGRELKLEWKHGAESDLHDTPHTKYELVYYEGQEEGESSELELKLIAIIEEQEILLKELESLEALLIAAKTEEEKIKIKKKIKIINKKLIIISQKITEFESFIHIYKTKITTKRYKIFHVVPFDDIPPIPVEGLQLNSVISDMGTDVFKEKAALKVEEELKRQYDGLGRWQVGSRLALFLGRGRKRKKMMRNEMNNMANTAFQTGAGYASLNDQSQNAADRHAHELLTNMAAINRITTVNNPQVDQLCKDYLNNVINDSTFQQRFNAIVAADTNIQNALNGQNITHIGTNILLQLKEQKALNMLIHTLDSQLSQYIATGNNVHMHNMQNYVEQYIKQYQKLPAFKATFEQFLKGDLNARNQLNRYLSHQKAIMNMQIANLRMNIDIVNQGKSAYQIDNKDREKGWKYKVGHFMDKHPWGTAIGTIALSVGLGLATAPMGAVAGAAVTTGVFGSYVGFTNYVKKWTHHTKEQNTHEKNVVTDYRNEQAKIQNWQNLALNGKGRKKYKAKRQLALYDQTTQENIKLSDQITECITNLSAKSGPLTADEDNFMKLSLIEGWARLKYYRAMGHNFLASENVDKTEKDMRRLEKAITLGLQKIGQNTNDIETTMTATNSLGTNITYDVIQNDLKASYDKSLIQFKRERRWLALRYGIGTAALSIGTALGMQYLMGTGVFAKDVPGTPGAPGTPSSTTNHAGGTDNFGLGKDEVLLPGELGYTTNPSGIHDATLTAITGAPNGSTVTFTYGVGTDATPVMSGHLTSHDLAGKIFDVRSSINHMSGLSGAQKASFLKELSNLSHAGFTNDNLASMRAAEYLQHCAQAMSDNGNTTLIPAFSRTLDVSGGTYNNLAERFMTGAIDVTTPAVPGTPGTPGIPAKTWGRWIMGVPLFFNTFKKRKPTTDTTDQNFGNNNQNNNQNGQQQP